MSRVTELQGIINALVTEAKTLKARKRQLEAEIKDLDKRINDLIGGWHNWGEIARAKDKLKKAELVERDSKARKVVWSKAPNKDDYVVEKVTPKRIYVREVGCEKSEYYKRDGKKDTSYSWSGEIDIEATFPEGLEQFAKDNK